MNFVTGSKASIFVRKTLQIRLRDRACGKPPALARREGPAFFDEDDVCAGHETQLQPHLNCIITTSSPKFQFVCDFTKIRNWFTI